MTVQTAELALAGGEPVCSESLSAETWPPVSETTADRLRELYLSREWSFHSPAEQEFVQTFADYHDTEHAIFMANGTVTLQCALEALGVGEGDEVIVPALTWMATAMAAHYVGATPVFVDVEPTTLCMDPDQLRDAITSRTKAVVPVHLYGSMADMEAIMDISNKHDIAVVEDCAHMQGGKWNGQGVGSWGDVGSFSFQQSKTLSSGEGGICITDDDELAERIFRLKHIGYAPDSEQGRPSGSPPSDLACHNFRATAFQALILQDQLSNLPKRIDRYETNARKITQQLATVPGVRIQSRGRLASTQGYYAFVFIFDQDPCAKVSTSMIRKALGAEGLNTGGTYGPVYDHVLFNLQKDQYRIHNDSCPVAEYAGTERAVQLPHSWLHSSDEVIDSVIEIVRKVALNTDKLQQWECEND